MMRGPQEEEQHRLKAFVRNPIALFGIGAIAAVLTVVLLVIFVGRGNGSGDTSAQISPSSKPQSTQAAASDLDGLIGKAKSTINIRSGPANGYEVLGLLLKNAKVTIIGQSEDGEWLQIQYPAHSNLSGWVLAESMDVEGSLAGLPIGTPETLPLAVVPTSEYVPPAETTEEAPEVAPTVEGALPDLVISDTLVSAGVLIVTVTNQGSGVLQASPIGVSVFDRTGMTLLNGTISAPTALNPGASIDIRTGFSTLGASEVLVVVDPGGNIKESDDTNNNMVVTLGPVETPSATKTPKKTPTPENPLETVTPQSQ